MGLGSIPSNSFAGMVQIEVTLWFWQGSLIEAKGERG
jgi:hypothetical protein